MRAKFSWADNVQRDSPPSAAQHYFWGTKVSLNRTSLWYYYVHSTKGVDLIFKRPVIVYGRSDSAGSVFSFRNSFAAIRRIFFSYLAGVCSSPGKFF